FSTRKPEPVQPLAAPPRETANTDGSGKTPAPAPTTTPIKESVEKPVDSHLEGGAERKVPKFSLEKPTLADLAEFLQKNKYAPEILIELEDLDLQRARDDRQPDLVISNPIVTIRPRTPGKRPTVRDGYHSQLVPTIQASFT